MKHLEADGAVAVQPPIWLLCYCCQNPSGVPVIRSTKLSSRIICCSSLPRDIPALPGVITLVRHVMVALPTPAVDSCSHCGKASINADYQQAFGISICSQCRSAEPVISKSNAKAEYLLSDADLKKLGALQRSNPQHREWAPMKMYLVSQVESVAVAKHGSLEVLSQQKQQKVRDKIEDRAKRRKTAEQDERKNQAHKQQLTAVHQKYSEDLQVQEEEFIDPDDGRRKKRFAPGLAAAEVEEL